MMNVYLKKYQDILEAYYMKQKALDKQIEENNKRYSPEYAENENKAVRAEKETTYEEAKALINKTFENVRLLLAYGSFLNVEDLTADRLIFESGFNLTKEDIQGYLERYANNFTMKRLIVDWVQKQPHPEQYGDIDFALPSDQLEVYKKFGEKALYICGLIYANKSIMQDPIEIYTFADETMNKHELDAIGSGIELEGYRKKRVPESHLHIFDKVNLSTFK